jgi:membrane protein implicated in regulation of membrane protease activity
VVRGPSVLQAFLIAVSGFALAFFGCLGALADTNFSSGETGTWGYVGIVAFFVGVAVLVYGFAAMVWRFLKRFTKPSPVPDRAEPPSET